MKFLSFSYCQIILELSTNHVQIGMFIVELDRGGGNLMQEGRGTHLMMDLKMELIV